MDPDRIVKTAIYIASAPSTMLLKVDLIANRTQSGHAIQQGCDNELLVKIISDGIIKGQKRDNATILREADSSI